MARKTTEELLAEEDKNIEQSKARKAQLIARQRGEQRKRDAHRKIVAGATLLFRVRVNPHLRRVVQDDFNRSVLNPKRRLVIADLLDEQAFQQAMQAEADEVAIEAKDEAPELAPPMRPMKAPGEPPSGAAPS
jgi:hypothetical protein